MLKHFRYTTLVTNTDDNRYIAMYIDRYNPLLVPLLWRTLRHPSVPQSWQKCREALRDMGSSFNKDKTESGCWELPPRCVWSSHSNSLYTGALRSGITVEKRSGENHIPGFSDCCFYLVNESDLTFVSIVWVEMTNQRQHLQMTPPMMRQASPLLHLLSQ